MKVCLLDTFRPAGVEFIARHADIVRRDDPRAKDWHEDADGLMVRMRPLTASDFAGAKRLKAVATPHAGAGTYETQAKSPVIVAEQLLLLLNGGAPLNRVA